MPTTDDPAPRSRRPLGRGPGTARNGSPGGGTPADETAALTEAEGGVDPVAEDGTLAPPPREDRPAQGRPAQGDRRARREQPLHEERSVHEERSARQERPGEQAFPDRGAGTAGAVDARKTAAFSGSPDPQDSAVVSAGRPDPGESAAPAEGEAGGDGKGPGGFTVRLDNFEGPFDLLLQLISKHKLDVTEVALSKVTDEFIVHIRAMGPDWELDQATEFLVVAATLLDLKAARLLPAAEVEDEEDLALLEARDLLFARLLQYRAYKQIAAVFAERWAAESPRHPRTVGLEPHHAELLPEVVISIGPVGLAALAAKAMTPKPRPAVYVEHIHTPLVSVREQAEGVVARLRELGAADFRTLVEDAPDTLTVVARFLALLELYRDRAVALEQQEALGELVVRWTGGERHRPTVTDEFDRLDTGAGGGGRGTAGGSGDGGSDGREGSPAKGAPRRPPPARAGDTPGRDRVPAREAAAAGRDRADRRTEGAGPDGG